MWNQQSSHLPATISATVMKILFVLRQKCPTCVIHLFPILPRFDQFFSNVRATNTYICFHVKIVFQTSYFMICHVQLSSTPSCTKPSSSPRPSHPIPTPSHPKPSLTPRPTQPIPLPTHTKPSSTIVSVQHAST